MWVKENLMINLNDSIYGYNYIFKMNLIDYCNYNSYYFVDELE